MTCQYEFCLIVVKIVVRRAFLKQFFMVDKFAYQIPIQYESDRVILQCSYEFRYIDVHVVFIYRLYVLSLHITGGTYALSSLVVNFDKNMLYSQLKLIPS